MNAPMKPTTLSSRSITVSAAGAFLSTTEEPFILRDLAQLSGISIKEIDIDADDVDDGGMYVEAILPEKAIETFALALNGCYDSLQINGMGFDYTSINSALTQMFSRAGQHIPATSLRIRNLEASIPPLNDFVRRYFSQTPKKRATIELQSLYLNDVDVIGKCIQLFVEHEAVEVFLDAQFYKLTVNEIETILKFLTNREDNYYCRFIAGCESRSEAKDLLERWNAKDYWAGYERKPHRGCFIIEMHGIEVVLHAIRGQTSLYTQIMISCGMRGTFAINTDCDHSVL
ncbi:hypothetical protein QR680_000270 [Steinernema hermaphroditum]|uniref:Uncharacterized protein n=1 Tax=Steinernema hermaphroditum TaxID=289476 RepID=A0AA39GUT6_9BILA|nr:hypothetical protein QR680_000270 [Steinernema hermaphroditum]